MKRSIVIVLLAITFLLLAPRPVMACEGWFCDLFGMTTRSEINAAKEQELARISREKDTEIARIQGESAARLADAEAQLQREIEAGQLSREQAAAQKEMFIQALDAATETKVRQLELEYGQASQVLGDQADIAMAGLAEAGKTNRWQTGWGAASGIVALVVIGCVLIFYIKRKETPAQPQVILIGLPSDRFQMPLPSNVQIVDHEEGSAS